MRAAVDDAGLGGAPDVRAGVDGRAWPERYDETRGQQHVGPCECELLAACDR